MPTTVAILDYGSGNLRSAHRAIARVGADVTITNDPREVLAADGLLVPGVGAFAACMRGLTAINGPRLIGERLAGSRPVMGICVGMQSFSNTGSSMGRMLPAAANGLAWSNASTPTFCPTWDGTPLTPPRLRHVAGIDESIRFYFVHSYGVQRWEFPEEGITTPPLVSWATHQTARFVAAVENGPLWATQFHPEKSGDAGAELLKNWLAQL